MAQPMALEMDQSVAVAKWHGNNGETITTRVEVADPRALWQALKDGRVEIEFVNALLLELNSALL